MTEDEPKILDGLTDERRKLIDAHFTSGIGLYRDVINIWTPLPMVLDGDSIDDAFLVDLKPLPHYAEYLDARQYAPSEIKYIAQKSSSEAITKFDSLIDEYNADRERIKKQKDGKKIKEFVSRAEALFKKPIPDDL